jgi:hypothetical protein
VLSGSFSFTFDDSLVGTIDDFPYGQEFTLPLDSLTLTPSRIGDTMFDTSNSGALLTYSLGGLIGIAVGGREDGVNGVRGGDDWAVGDDWTAGVGTPGHGDAALAIKVGRLVAFSSGCTYFYAIREVPSTVPEPSTVLASALVFLGLAVLFGRKALLRRNAH